MFPEIVEFTTRTDTFVFPAEVPMPPPTLLLTVESVSTTPGLSGPVEMPAAPPCPLLFASMLERTTVTSPFEPIPPPVLGWFPVIVLSTIVRGPVAKTPPPVPLPWLPPVIVRSFTVTRPVSSWMNTLSAQVCRTVCPSP